MEKSGLMRLFGYKGKDAWRKLLNMLPMVIGIVILSLLLSGVVYVLRLWVTLTHL